MKMEYVQSNIPAGDDPIEDRQDAFVDSYLLYLLAQASTAASAAFHAQLADEGVPVATWRVLASLYPDKTLNVGDLARRCLTKQPTLTRQLDRLCAEGLTARAHADEDRRTVLVRLTEAGQAQARGYVEMAKRHETQVLKDYTPAEVEALKETLIDLARRVRAG